MGHQNCDGADLPVKNKFKIKRFPIITFALCLCRYNLLTEFPDDLASLTSLVGLYLSTNKFTGPIPEAICELQNLRALELDFNQLSGPVPECIGKLTRVQTLHLGTNHLNGTMPAAFANLVNLKVKANPKSSRAFVQRRCNHRLALPPCQERWRQCATACLHPRRPAVVQSFGTCYGACNGACKLSCF